MPKVPYVYEMGNEDRFGKRKKVTQKEKEFLELYVAKGAKTYLNHKECAKIVYGVNDSSGNAMGYQIINKPRIKKILKEEFEDPQIDNLIVKGTLKRLKNSNSRYWQQTADYVSKIRGDFAPERTVNMNMTPEDRDNELAEVARLLNVDTNIKQLAEGPDDNNTESETVPSVLPVERSKE